MRDKQAKISLCLPYGKQTWCQVGICEKVRSFSYDSKSESWVKHWWLRRKPYHKCDMWNWNFQNPNEFARQNLKNYCRYWRNLEVLKRNGYASRYIHSKRWIWWEQCDILKYSLSYMLSLFLFILASVYMHYNLYFAR